MVTLNKIYTKTGDKGETVLVGGLKVAKHSLRPDAFGEVDELNSIIGIVRTYISKDEQSELILVLANVDAECCLAINDMTPERDIEWMLDTALKCSIIIFNLKWVKVDRDAICYGWLLNKNNCYQN